MTRQRSAVAVHKSDFGAFHLSAFGPSPELIDRLVQVVEALRDLAEGQISAHGVERQAAVVIDAAALNEGSTFTDATETEFLEHDQIGKTERRRGLHEIDVSGLESRHFIGLTSRYQGTGANQVRTVFEGGKPNVPMRSLTHSWVLH